MNPNIILAIDTSSDACSLALEHDGKIYSDHRPGAAKQSRNILPMIESLLQEAGIKRNQIELIAFAHGPGSFTGIRIAVAVAQGLAFALDIPVIGVSSLQVAAQSAYEQHGWEQVIVANDARMDEVYYGAYRFEGGIMQAVSPDQLCAPEDVKIPSPSAGDGCGWVGIGSAWNVYKNNINQEVMSDICKIPPQFIPDARALIYAAKKLELQGESVGAENAMPVYLREQVAKKKQ